MSHVPLPNSSRSKAFLCYPPKPPSLQSSTSVSPAMETSFSSDGNVYPDSTYGHFDQSGYLPAYMGAAGIDWSAKNIPFVEPENTPSLSSSYEFQDLPKDGPPTWDMPFQAQTPLMAINDKTFQPVNPQWNLWPNQDPWIQPYFNQNYSDSNWQHLHSMAQDHKSFQMPMEHHIIHQSTPITYIHAATSTQDQSQIQLPTSSHYHPEPTHVQSSHPLTTQHQQTPESLYSPIPNQLPTAPQNHLKATLHYTDTRNAFLIDCKRRGLSYKEIKRMGGFKEAESTLRGRFRTLTKSKEQRVRKPKWLERDVTLLIEAVSIYTDKDYVYEGDELRGQQRGQGQPPKVSWKKVAQFIWANGGSYQFGNATCKKKWCEIYGVNI
ncbi:hypothetical protein N7520_005218 [Penicillium odoratum]|uniref:uncharacterized protein n=1 Tax=Penicillium odoratum TaxID=1167516 RepID=UPI0025482D3D|nr:uncharacterized protein N7520_005218 [Penicillium odoratum]KAJ5765659.1 hypothetical protein N7520_005218 [Penicillium odoratum]